MSSPSECADLVEDCILLHEPFYMEGAVGIGKSQVVAQVCKKLKMELIDERASQMDPTDIKGFPWPDGTKMLMHWLPSSRLPPMKAKTKGLLFLDELSSAPLAVQAACYQLILDRCVGDYILPDGWTVGGAGNRMIDRAITNRMSSALNNRFIHIDFETSVEDVVSYGRTVGISDDLIAFLRFRPNLLHAFDPTLNPKAFPSPRGWFKVDKVTKSNRPVAREFNLITGIVGHGAAVEFREFMRNRLSLPTIIEIKANPDTAKLPKSAGELYAITTSMASATTRDAYPKFLKYIERAEEEWQIIFNRDASNVCKDLNRVPEFKAWSIAHRDVVL